MVGDLKPYPAYRNSGVPWFGEIPEHWDVARNRRLFVRRNEPGAPDLPVLEVSLKTGVRVRRFTDSGRKQVLSDASGYRRAVQGDIAYNMMRMWQGAVGVAPTDGLVSPAYIVARPLTGTHGKYYAYLFRTGAYMEEVDTCSRGIVKDRNRLYWEDFKQIPSVFPPPEEQLAIVRLLAHVDRRIRGCIRAERRLMALLNEQKEAMIHCAVTRGLNPKVRLKPSGVGWLHGIPEHWMMVRLRSMAELVTSGSRDWAQYYSDEGPLFLRIGNLSTSYVDLKLDDLQRVSPPSGSEGERTSVEAGDILLSITALVGATGVVGDGLGQAYVNQHTALIRLRKGTCSSRWIGAVLVSSPGSSVSDPHERRHKGGAESR